MESPQPVLAHRKAPGQWLVDGWVNTFPRSEFWVPTSSSLSHTSPTLVPDLCLTKDSLPASVACYPMTRALCSCEGLKCLETLKFFLGPEI